MSPKLSILLLFLFPACINQNTAITQPAPTQPVDTPVCKSYFNQQLKTKVYTKVETPPDYPGGMAAYQRFLSRNLRYPQDLIDDERSPPTVTKMTFIVTEDGRIINLAVGGKTDTLNMTSWEKEILRITKLMGNWTPGLCNGKAVTTEVDRPFVMSVHLEIEG